MNKPQTKHVPRRRCMTAYKPPGEYTFQLLSFINRLYFGSSFSFSKNVVLGVYQDNRSLCAVVYPSSGRQVNNIEYDRFKIEKNDLSVILVHLCVCVWRGGGFTPYQQYFNYLKSQ